MDHDRKTVAILLTFRKPASRAGPETTEPALCQLLPSKGSLNGILNTSGPIKGASGRIRTCD